MAQNKNFKELLAEVEAIVFDVDGVMTDGGIIPLADGDFIRKYHAKDGYALAYAVKQGFNIGVISGGFGKTLASRLNRLGIKYQYLGCMDKLAALEDFIAKTGAKRENIIYMGDDIPDLEVMRIVGIPQGHGNRCNNADSILKLQLQSRLVYHAEIRSICALPFCIYPAGLTAGIFLTADCVRTIGFM